MIGSLALIFHFQPGELWEFDLDELKFWHERAEEVTDGRK